MIELTQNDKFISEKTINSFQITFPKTVRLLFGTYTKQHILHNLKLKIKNNLSKENSNHTYVRGGMTDWEFFIKDLDFSVFFTDIMDKNKHVLAPEHILSKELKVIDAWGNCLKKGDHVALHNHNTFHGILYLTEGCPLIFPELEIKFTPKPGDWIISPPDLLHGTDLVDSENERINVVFNFTFYDNFRRINEKLER
jgi:quercetin dioxygenase-like cupin family protein